MIAKTQTYAVLLRKRTCRDLFTFSDKKCPLFTRLGGGIAGGGQCYLFCRFFFIAGLPLIRTMCRSVPTSLCVHVDCEGIIFVHNILSMEPICSEAIMGMMGSKRMRRRYTSHANQRNLLKLKATCQSASTSTDVQSECGLCKICFFFHFLSTEPIYSKKHPTRRPPSRDLPTMTNASTDNILGQYDLI